MLKIMFHTNQTVFDAAMLYFQQQKSRCINHNGNCSYLVKNKNNDRCVIGWMLPLEELREDPPLLVSHIEALIVQGFVKKPDQVSTSLLMTLQHIHDRKDHWDAEGFIGWHLLYLLSLEYGLNNEPYLNFFAEKSILKEEQKVLVPC